MTLLAALPATLQSLIQKLNLADLSPAARLLLSGAALALILRFAWGRKWAKRTYVFDLNKVGAKVGGTTSLAAEFEYDVIVAGGGKSPQFLPPLLTIFISSTRHRRLRARCPSIRGPQLARLITRSRRKVPPLFISSSTRPH